MERGLSWTGNAAAAQPAAAQPGRRVGVAGAHALDIDALATIRATGLDCAGHRGAATAAAALAAAAVRKLALPVLLLAVCSRYARVLLRNSRSVSTIDNAGKYSNAQVENCVMSNEGQLGSA